jgi:hypothetical protein
MLEINEKDAALMDKWAMPSGSSEGVKGVVGPKDAWTVSASLFRLRRSPR